MSQPSNLGWLFSFVTPHRMSVIGVLLLSVVATGLSLLQPWITKLLIDDGLIAQNFTVLAWLCAAMVLLSFCSSLLGGFNQHYYTQLSARVLFSLRGSVYQHLQTLSPDFYARRSRGDLLSRINGDVAEIQRFATDGLLASFNGVLALLGSLILLVSLSPVLSLFAFVLLPVQLVFLSYMRPRIERQTHVIREHTGKLGDFFVSTLSSMKFIQATNAQERQKHQLDSLSDGYLKNLLRLNLLNYTTSGVPGLLLVINTSLIFLLGGYWVIQGEFTLGTLMAFTMYLGRATGPVQTLLGLYVASRRAKVSLDRVSEMMQAAPAVTEPESPKFLDEKSPADIVFRNVAFSYPEAAQPVLKDVNLTIPEGNKVAIIGDSGAGKSTIIDLLHRHWDPNVGSISLGGIMLRDLSLMQLRQYVAVVSQETILFAGSIAENIKFANPQASDEAMIQAAQQAQLDGWIRQLPEGYESHIGEQGRLLSGGQRQRLSIARALLQEPRVLILDEATASIDEETERAIIDSVDQLFSHCTRIVISHQAGPLRDADQWFRLENGQLRSSNAR
ncbi:ABC transporter ATP-binding protein/permease [Aestuariicella sp. G3-2]|uniref:ABC transporter ATP-binding protein n=1 Tax=Pseudomaricurvus albidus TaxID=2842452 RepID=UPI001C0DC296|nr:ABC transporter ATP-binding protein [Aestuariicella albida]MBU3070951.1 ABC transporter ATP-binding protein/permease [Aestuariicella albida]